MYTPNIRPKPKIISDSKKEDHSVMRSHRPSFSDDTLQYRLNIASEDRLRELNDQLEGQTLEERLRWCWEMLPNESLVQVSAFGASGMVIIDALARLGLTCTTIFLDTLHHFPETLDHVKEVKVQYNLDLRTYRCAKASSRSDFEKRFGSERMWETDPTQYDYLVKVEPLERALDDFGVEAWITGRRRDQDGDRASLPILQRDESDGRLKINPVADWSLAKIWRYLLDNKVPYNKLYDQGYKSIGDVVTTRSVAAHEAERSGRFYQNNGLKTECGIHTRPQKNVCSTFR